MYSSYSWHIDSTTLDEKRNSFVSLTFVPYQCCPLCNGSGRTFPVGISNVVFETCRVCNGAGIIPMHVVENRGVVQR